ncbi:MAG: hypothetical protein R2932_54085 [Caldilineaceae bacterium]
MTNQMLNTAPATMRDRMGQVINDLIETDPQTALVLADISTTYFREARAKYPARVINLGIMEQTAVSLRPGWHWRAFTRLSTRSRPL